MSTTSHIKLIALTFLLLGIMGRVTGQSKTTSNKPNIIFILTDDQRFDAIGYQGNKLVSTPEMDKLAKQGTYFKTAIATTPICAASRASILSGTQERRNNYNFTTDDILEKYMTHAYPRELKKVGFKTAFYCKLGVNYDKEKELFDEIDSYGRNNAYKDYRGYFYKTIGKDTVHLTRYTGQQALDYIDKQDKSKPFCLSLSFSAPHAHDSAPLQYFWQSSSDKILANTIMPGPVLGEDKYFQEQPEFVKSGFNRLRWTWRYDTPEKYQHSVKGYYRMITEIDNEIAKIRTNLVKKGLDKNTVIILMGDNGYFIGERQLAGKWLMYDNSIRVPLIIYDPRVTKHVDSDIMALNIDVPCTILDLAGVKQPSIYQGKSLMPIVRSATKSINRDTVLIEHLWEFDQIPPSEGIRTERYKYFRYVNNMDFEELYDIKADPSEINNLAKNPTFASTLRLLRDKCNDMIKKSGDETTDPPTNLSVELIRDARFTKILDKNPEYSWIVPRVSSGQNGYQILFASSLQNINKNIGDIWNSNLVESSQSCEVEHKGNALKAGKTYYWKVRIWDGSNRTSAYSLAREFTVGNSYSYMISSENYFQKELISPVKITKIDESRYFVDFGKAAFGTLNFEYNATTKDSIIVHLGEQLNSDGMINRSSAAKSHIRYSMVKVGVSSGKKWYQVKLIADARNTKLEAVALPDSFPIVTPFRYAEFENIKQPITSTTVNQEAYFIYWEEARSAFSSSDNILNQVWDLCKYSIKATTFSGLYMDGDRERIPYEADAYLNQLSHYTTDNEYAIARRTIEYFMQHPKWRTELQQHVALMVHADYMYTGNSELIAKYYEDIKHKSLMELRNTYGLITSTKSTPAFMKKLGFKNEKDELKDITDWPPANWVGDTTVMGERDGFIFMPYNTVINAFYVKNMEIMAEFADILGKNIEATEFRMLALHVTKSMNEKMLDKAQGIYTDGIGTNHSSLHANMMALAFGIVPKEYQKTVVTFIKSRGMACSVYGSQYLLEALYNGGEGEYAHELMSATHDRSWYNMIKIGSTISLEAWDMKYKPNADWNHAWGATPANIIPRHVWSIQPKVLGYSIATINPQLGKLKTSKIKVPTIRGDIEAEYKYVSDRNQVYTITIPTNMVAEMPVKAGGEIITINGLKANTKFGSLRLMSGVNVVEFTINSC